MRNKRMKMIAILMAVITLSIVLFSGCASLSTTNDLNLKQQVCTEKLLNYYLDDGTMVSSTVKEFEIISSRTTDGYDTSEVKVVLSDAFVERTLFLTVESTKYNQGWLVDSMEVTDSSLNLVGGFDQSYISSQVSEDYYDTFDYGNYFSSHNVNGVKVGFHNLSQVDSYILNNTFYADYAVNDRYSYVDISGILKVSVEVSMIVDYDNRCYVDRYFECNSDAVTSDWHDIYGTYELLVPGHQNFEQYITVDESENVYGYREYIGYWDNEIQHSDLTGTFEECNYSTAVVCVSDNDNYFEYIIFEPDEIKYKYVHANGSDYDQGDSFNTVYFRKIS